MRRLSIVPLIAAAIVIGHVGPHLLNTLTMRQLTLGPSDPPASLQTALGSESPPLVVPTCRLQPQASVTDHEPMLDALRRLIAREEARYPYLAENDRTIVARFEPCGGTVRRHGGIGSLE